MRRRRNVGGKLKKLAKKATDILLIFKQVMSEIRYPYSMKGEHTKQIDEDIGW